MKILVINSKLALNRKSSLQPRGTGTQLSYPKGWWTNIVVGLDSDGGNDATLD